MFHLQVISLGQFFVRLSKVIGNDLGIFFLINSNTFKVELLKNHFLFQMSALETWCYNSNKSETLILIVTFVKVNVKAKEIKFNWSGWVSSLTLFDMWGSPPTWKVFKMLNFDVVMIATMSRNIFENSSPPHVKYNKNYLMPYRVNILCLVSTYLWSYPLSLA